ncbi:sigma factor-like helix-turn-helix DNA-binding protein [Segeticoccus rhizosphaerae]|uniref:sigma factor-like helix-turn-helix DNA-binding protein n=1 Tax=Segeticoccus rhizosphaerae TaxID=1104777 RepID=UPI00236747C8|nr:sigma factor-like helix-turn-helix DNA-binding protein [Ornithinicoccus soli]
MTSPPSRWLPAAWSALPDRSKEIVSRRAEGETLAVIGDDIGVTRERVRQLEKQARKLIVSAQEIHEPELLTRLLEHMGEQVLLSDEQVEEVIGSAPAAAVDLVLRQLGFERSMIASGGREGFWSREPSALESRLKSLVDLMPLPDDEAHIAAESLKIPAEVRWWTLLPARYRVTLTDLGWVRTSRTTRDRAYLWLRSQGEPRSSKEIAEAAGASEHATRENMRRDHAFAQVRPEGTWALVDWRVEGADNRYSNALEVVVEVLRDLGPLEANDLRVECQRRYPVTGWRITQCLSSNLIGQNDAGLYDLVERGAVPVEDREPHRPAHIQASGDVVGVEVPVSHDVVRGSGIPVNRWLTWYLGLRTSPSTRYFQMQQGASELVVRRGTSNAQLSSLRTGALAVGAVEGCRLVLLLHLNDDTAELRHVCEPSACVARTQ